MAANTYGKIFTLTSFGESHGNAIGGVIDGCPAGINLSLTEIQNELDRRKPGQSAITTARKESDTVEFLSGLMNNTTTGAPIGFIIQNENQHSNDYDHLKQAYRPSHADYTYQVKYGIRDYAGGGRASARETAVRVVAGAIAKQILRKYNIKIQAFVSSVGEVDIHLLSYIESEEWLATYRENEVRCPDEVASEKMRQLILETKKSGDTIGGRITCVCYGIPPGIGEPIFEKLSGQLAYSMMSIQATKGFEYGMGFESTRKKGSELNDIFYRDEAGNVKTRSNHSGGIQGGISNGMPVYFTVGFKPVSTIMKTQTSIDASGNTIQLPAKGRHDACVVPRAVPIVEAMAAITLLDSLLLSNTLR